MDWALLFFLHWSMAALTAVIAHRKGRSEVGFFLYGLLLWPFALVHALIALPNAQVLRQRAEDAGRIECPYCAEYIKPNAKVCFICRRDLRDLSHDARSQLSIEARATEEAGLIDGAGGLRKSVSIVPAASRRAAKNKKSALAEVSISPDAPASRISRILKPVENHSYRLMVTAIIILSVGIVALTTLWNRTDRVQPELIVELSEDDTEPGSKAAPPGPGTFSEEAICKSGIATRMGRDPSIIAIDGTLDGVIFLSYTQPDDGTHWAYKCKLEGDRILWGSKTGRWRVRPMDSTIIYLIRGDTIRVEDHFTDGVYRREFNLEQLR